MQILLTFDVEVWCAGWTDLDRKFPNEFQRAVYGDSAAGFALPKTLEILNRHGLRGIYLVEALFAARFGVEYLRRIVAQIQEAGHEVQLHLHPEWADEIEPPPLPEVREKRPMLRHYSLEQQRRLIDMAAELMVAAGAAQPVAFRAGNMSASPQTFEALQASGIRIDSSIDAAISHCSPELRDTMDFYHPSYVDEVACYPITVFRDGWGKERHAQIGACAVGELIQAIDLAQKLGWHHFVLLSHNFEMLKVNKSVPDRIVVRRFERLAAYLESIAELHPTVHTPTLAAPAMLACTQMPSVSFGATFRRSSEQALRTLL